MKIVLTGGPSAGKTALLHTIQKEYGTKVATVPEAASMLFSGGFPRDPAPRHIYHQQRAIYCLQLELEAMLGEEAGRKPVICDRGTMDGAAYWPPGEGDFFSGVGTTRESELRRYDVVIHLESAPGIYYDYTNPVRSETPLQAQEIDQKVKDAWAGHPRRVIIPSVHLFSKKVAIALEVVSDVLEGRPLRHLK